MADNPVLPSYIIPNQPDPAAAVRSNVELVMGLAQSQRQQQQFQMAQQLHNAQLQEAQQKIAGTDLLRQQDMDYQQRMLTLKQKPGGPTSDDIIAMSQTPTGLRHAEALNQNIAKLEEKEKFGLVQQGNKVYNAIDRGEIGIAKKELLTGVEAYKNSGQMQYSNMWKGLADTLDKDPAAVKLQLGSTLNTLDPKFTENYSKQKGAENLLEGEKLDTLTKKDTLDNAERVRAQELATKAAAERSSNASAAESTQKREQEKQKFEIELPGLRRAAGSLSPADTKAFEEDRTSYLANKALSNKLGGVIKGYETEKPTPGLQGHIETQYRTLMGTRTSADALKTQYNQVANAATLEQLKGAGRMTQGEIDLIKGGLPSVNAKAGEISNFLRALKKATDEKAALSQENLQWMAANQGSGPAKTDITYNGLTFKKGALPPELTPVAPDARPMTHNAIRSMIEYVNHPGGDPAKKAIYTAELAKRGLVPSG